MLPLTVRAYLQDFGKRGWWAQSAFFQFNFFVVVATNRKSKLKEAKEYQVKAKRTDGARRRNWSWRWRWGGLVDWGFCCFCFCLFGSERLLLHRKIQPSCSCIRLSATRVSLTDSCTVELPFLLCFGSSGFNLFASGVVVFLGLLLSSAFYLRAIFLSYFGNKHKTNLQNKENWYTQVASLFQVFHLLVMTLVVFIVGKFYRTLTLMYR